MEIRELRKCDYQKVIQFAISGMHLNWYVDNPLVLRLYGRYFLYLELNRATQIMAAYDGSNLKGLLLAEMKGEPLRAYSLWRQLYVWCFDWLQHRIEKKGSKLYEATNQEIYWKFKEKYSPDGEIIFLAVAPEAVGKGIGSFLINEFARTEPGKRIWLYTDSSCTWQFYEKQGFKRIEQANILISLKHRDIPLECYLYSKKINEKDGIDDNSATEQFVV